MVRVYHPQYEEFFDRKTRVQFERSVLDGRVVASAGVPPALVRDLLVRGFLVWPSTDEPEVVLPADFPSRALLDAAGFRTPGAVRAASDEDLRSVKGVGPAALRAIRDALD